jgi:hypothetical protein
VSLRRLLALKLLLTWRSIPASRRTVTLVMMAIFTLVTIPAWYGGATLTFSGVRLLGAPALVLAFASAQATWVVLVLIMNVWGEAFDMRRMLRFPVHPRMLHLSSVVMSAAELPVLFVTPGLIGAVLGVGARGGVWAGLAALVALALLFVITASLLQLLLALVGAMRHHPLLRRLHEALATVVGAFGYLMMVNARDHVAKVIHDAGPDLLPRVTRLAAFIEPLVPTAAWPTWIAGGVLAGDPLRAAIGLALSLAVALVLIEAGWRLAHRLALGRESGPRVKRERVAGARPLAPRPWRRLLPASLGLLMEREVVLVLRGPQLFGMLAFAVFVGVMFRYFGGGVLSSAAPMVAMLLSIQVQGLTASLFGSEREGLRTLFLLPIASRALVLAKDLTVLLQFAFTLVISLAAFAIAQGGIEVRFAGEVAVTATGLALVGLLIGNRNSIVMPMRADARGRFRTAGSVSANLLHALGLFAALGVIVLLAWGVRALVPAEMKAAVGLLAPGVLVLGLAAAWWLSLAPTARLLDAHREQMLSAIATPTEMG